MDVATRRRPNTTAPGDGSRTLTMTNDPTKEEGEDDQGSSNPGGDVVGTLRLRATPRTNRPRVAWNEDVIDNEGCGKKKSKICCIYHKPRRFDESSDESDSDSDSDSSSACGGNHNHNHARHNHQPHDGPTSRSDPGSGAVHELDRPIESEPNAYEKQPKGKRKA